MREKAKEVKLHGKETDRLWEFDGEGGESTGQFALPPVSLPAYSTEEVSLLPALGQLPLPLPYASLRVQYTGTTGGVIAEVASVDEANDLVVDSHVVNEGWGWAGSGGNPYHLDDQTETILFLTDMGEKPVRIGFVVTGGGEKQVLSQLRLQPHETRAINLRKLRDAQRKDHKGHRLPADASDGTVLWLRADNVPVAGRMVMINRRHGVASNYDCCICICPAYYSPWYKDYVGLSVCTTGYDCGGGTSVDLLVDGSVQLYAYAAYTDCNGTYMYSSNVNGLMTWWASGNSSVATVTPSGGNVTGVDAGTTSISAEHYECAEWYPDISPWCMCSYGNDYTAYATVKVCDYTITPQSLTAPTCDNRTENAVKFYAKPSTGCTINGNLDMTTVQITRSGNLDVDINNSYPNYNNITGYFEAHVSYWAGPVQSNGLAGTLTPTFHVAFQPSTATKTKSVDAEVACPQ